MAGGAIGADLVGAGEHAHGTPDDARTMGAHIGALVVEEFVVDAEQTPVLVDRGADAVALLARMVGGDQVLAAVLDPFHRTAEALGGDQYQNVFRIEFAAHAEAAAGVAFVEVDLRRRDPEHAHQRVLVPMRHLGGAVQFEHVMGGVVEADGAAGLHRHAGMTADGEIEFDHRMGGGERRVDVAKAVAHGERRGAAAVVEFAGRVARGHERRQRLDLDLDEIGRIFGKIGILGEYRRHGVADITHPAYSQHRLTIGFDLIGRARGVAEIDRRDVGDVGAGPHRHDAREPQCRCRVDAHDPAMGDGRPHHAHMELMGEGDVAGEQPASGHQRPVLDARHRMPEHAALVRPGGTG